MRKDKTWIIDLFDEGTYGRAKMENLANADFYTSDTHAYLNFRPSNQDFAFTSATVALYNRDDMSLVSVPATVANNEASYRMSSEVIAHWGRWTAQVIFIQGSERHTSPVMNFEVERHLMDERPPRIELIDDWSSFITDAQETYNLMIADLEGFEESYAPRLTELSTKNAHITSVIAFGAVGDGVTDDTSAIQSALAYMNTTYSQKENYWSDIYKKGTLLFPEGYDFVVTDTLTATGHFNIHIMSPLRYAGTGGKTMFRIGTDTTNTTHCDYILGGRTSVDGVIGFEMINQLSCSIKTNKIHGFDEGLRAVAKNSLGWCGNTCQFGTFYACMVDLHITSYTSGWPNANVFIGGFFLKETRAVPEQNCVKISSGDGTYVAMDSNLFIGLNFENGKSNTIPIRLDAGITNRFADIRVENVSDRALAYIEMYGNEIDLRYIYASSDKILTSESQHGFVGNKNSMNLIYDSGSIGKDSVMTNDLRTYHPNLSFRNLYSSNPPSALSGGEHFALTEMGLRFDSAASMIATRIKVESDKFFNIKLSKETNKRLNIGIKCFGENMVELPMYTESMSNTDWNSDAYIKTQSNQPTYVNANIPHSSTLGAYMMPSDGFSDVIIEVHPDVYFFEVYLRQGDTEETRDATLGRITIHSEGGTAQYVDGTSDKGDYALIGSRVFNSSAFDNLDVDPDTPQLPMVYDTGDLGLTSVMSNDLRLYHPSLIFKNTYLSAPPSVLSGEEDYLLSSDGATINAPNTALAFTMKVNDDDRFILRVEKDEKLINMAFRPLDGNRVPLSPLDNPSINVEPWNDDYYLVEQRNAAFWLNVNIPYTGSGGSYYTPSDIYSEVEFVAHPDVKYIEVYVRQGSTAGTNEATIKRISMYGNRGTARHVDLVENRSSYVVIGGQLYFQSIIRGKLDTTLVGEEPEELIHPIVYSTGDLGQTTILTSDSREWHPTLAFKNTWSTTPPTALPSSPDHLSHSSAGLWLLNGNVQLMFKMDVRDDDVFVVEVAKNEKLINMAVRPLNINGNPMTLNNPAIDVPPWNDNYYIKGEGGTSFYVSASVPDEATPSYLTGSDDQSEIQFTIHPDVKYLEFYIRHGNTTGTNDATIRRVTVRGNRGSATVIEASTDRTNYKVIGGNIYGQTVVDGALQLIQI